MLAGMLSLLPSVAAADTFSGPRDDFRDETIYFLLTSRFNDGDPSNNSQCWDNIEANKGCPPWRGDFKGMIEKLDYIKALGFTAIWMTPIVENASGYDYHGYHAFDMSKVDFRLESPGASFQDLINEAHKRDMKIILDIVLNHTGNFGEANLFPLFKRDYTKTQSSWAESLTPIREKDGGRLPNNYYKLDGTAQYQARIKALKNGNGNSDFENIYHHTANNWNWDEHNRWWGQIADDCVDLNTENPKVYNYLVDCYGKFIEMGVDGFRIDTSGHLSPLTLQKVFIPRFQEIADNSKGKRNGGPFFMFGEVCSRFNDVTYRDHNDLSPWFYQWKIQKDYPWDHNADSWNGLVVPSGREADHVNINSCNQFGLDNFGNTNQPDSKNYLLDGNKYRPVDHSQYSGMSVIDYPMHMFFSSTSRAFQVKNGDHLYVDPSFNVTYVDSHDYGPADGATRPSYANSRLADNANLLFAWRGIPCVYYGSEVRFKYGCAIDLGPRGNIDDTGRAYFGGYIKGDVDVDDFGQFSNATGNLAVALNHPMAQHYRRLNLLRAKIPALRRGQYSTEGCKSENVAFKRRFTDASTDSYVVVALGAPASFSGIENGHYVEAITGEHVDVADGTLKVDNLTEGNMRIFVLDTPLSPAPGKIGEDGPFLFDKTPVGDPTIMDAEFDGTETEPSPNEGPLPDPDFVPFDDWIDEPVIVVGEEKCVFFDNSSTNWKQVKTWIWNANNTSENFTGGSWPGYDMTFDEVSGLWKYSFKTELPDSSLMVIFNNGSAQTADLSFNNYGIYNASGFTGNFTSAANIAKEVRRIKVSVSGGILSIESLSPVLIPLIRPDGSLLMISLKEGVTTIPGLPSGVYILNNRKIIL